MDSDRLETVVTYLALRLLVLGVAFAVVAVADAALHWDLLFGLFESLTWLLLASILLFAVGAIAASLLLNLRRVALALGRIADRAGRS